MALQGWCWPAPVFFNPVGSSLLARNHWKNNSGWILLAVEDLDRARDGARSSDFRAAGLEIAGKVGEEGAGDLHADPVSGEK